jgi:putative endopeptidase
MQDHVNDYLISIIKSTQQSARIRRQHNKDMQAIAAFAQSILNADSKKIALKDVTELLGSVGCIKDARTICEKLGEFAYAKICNLISIYDGPEERNSRHWRIHLGAPSLALPDAKYYDKSAGAYEQEILVAYSAMLHKLGRAFGYDDIEQFSNMEVEYAPILRAVLEEESPVYSGSDLVKEYPGIDWESFWHPFGETAAHWKNMQFVVDSPKWFAHLEKMLKTYTVDRWKIWFRGAIIVCYAHYLPSYYRAPYNALFGERLTGIKKQSAPMKELLSSIKIYLSVPLSRIYIARTVDKVYRQQIAHFIKTLLAATVARLSKVPWLQPATKRLALKKVRQIHLGILYPTLATNYETPQLDDVHIIKNISTIGQSLTQREFKDAHKKYSTEAWDNPVYSVNAYYLATGNRLIIPAAIAAWPFYCASASAGWNYGGLGTVVGHEITHAFDADGKDYDAEGDLRPWWTAADNRGYNKVTRALIDLYNKSELEGRHVDGTQTLSENLADLGGMAIALEALEQKIGNRSADERKRELRDFFTSYAMSWREKKRRAQTMKQLVSDVHAAAEFRVNNIVCQFDAWYEAFDVDADDPLYIEPAKRIRIY